MSIDLATSVNNWEKCVLDSSFSFKCEGRKFRVTLPNGKAVSVTLTAMVDKTIDLLIRVIKELEARHAEDPIRGKLLCLKIHTILAALEKKDKESQKKFEELNGCVKVWIRLRLSLACKHEDITESVAAGKKALKKVDDILRAKVEVFRLATKCSDLRTKILKSDAKIQQHEGDAKLEETTEKLRISQAETEALKGALSILKTPYDWDGINLA